MDISTIATAYADSFSSWHSGYLFWRTIYYLLGVTAVALPAFVAAGLPRNELGKRLTSALAAAAVGIFAWLQPGEKTTAHEHAYVCIELALDALHAGAYHSAEDFKRDADQCGDLLNYGYSDRKPH